MNMIVQVTLLLVIYITQHSKTEASCVPVDICAGKNHACALMENGSIQCWGRNKSGQLGSGQTFDQFWVHGAQNYRQVDLGKGQKATQVVCGANFSCAVLINKEVKCWGENGGKQLGVDTHKEIVGLYPSDMGSNLRSVWDYSTNSSLRADFVSLSGSFGCAKTVQEEGATVVKCWGTDRHGRLGTGTTQQSSFAKEPVDLSLSSPIDQISLGSYHSCVLTTSGNVYCWGFGRLGQLGNGKSIDIGNEPNGMGSNLGAIDLGSVLDATGTTQKATAFQVATGDSHTCAVLNENKSKMKCWGFYKAGQPRIGNVYVGDKEGEMGDNLTTLKFENEIVQVQSGLHYTDYTCVLLKDGNVKCWGSNGHGQLGIETNSENLGVFVEEKNEVDMSGIVAVSLPPGRKAVKFSSGTILCAILDDRSVTCWGAPTNYSFYPTIQEYVPRKLDCNNVGQCQGFKCPGTSTCIPHENGTTRCVCPGGTFIDGDKSKDGMLVGTGDTCSFRTCSDTGDEFVEIAASYDFSCVRTKNGKVACWGSNKFGQLGIESIAPRRNFPSEPKVEYVNLGTGMRAKQLSVYGKQVCTLLESGDAKCWGDTLIGNFGRQPGTMGDNLPVLNLGVSPNVTVTQLGNGGQASLYDSTTCFLLSNHKIICQFAHESEFREIDFGTDYVATQVSVGYEHVCAIVDDGKVKCYGRNSEGQLGLGDSDSRPNEPEYMGDNLPYVDLGDVRAMQVVAKVFGTCALLENGKVVCWGRVLVIGENGKVESKRIGDQKGEMGKNLKPVPLNQRVIRIDGTSSHTCALLESDSVSCWGGHRGNHLGTVIQDNGIGSVYIGRLPKLKNVVQVATGSGYSCALMSDSTVQCWGKNTDGFLGVGVEIAEVPPAPIPIGCTCGRGVDAREQYGVCNAITCNTGNGFCNQGDCYGSTGNGMCSKCKKNFEGENCDQCSEGWVGKNCDECTAGWTGKYCHEPVKDCNATQCASQTDTIILGVGAACGLLLLSSCLVYFIRQRSHTRRNNDREVLALSIPTAEAVSSDLKDTYSSPTYALPLSRDPSVSL